MWHHAYSKLNSPTWKTRKISRFYDKDRMTRFRYNIQNTCTEEKKIVFNSKTYVRMSHTYLITHHLSGGDTLFERSFAARRHILKRASRSYYKITKYVLIAILLIYYQLSARFSLFFKSNCNYFNLNFCTNILLLKNF